MTNVICDNCGWTGDSSECEEVRDAWERVQAGDVMPHGDCPKCESGCYEPDRPNPLASMLSECVEALEFQIMGDSEEHSRTQRDIIERAKALMPDQSPAQVRAWSIQCGFNATHGQRITVEASTIEEACKLAIEEADNAANWHSMSDASGATFVDWIEGEGVSEPVPHRFSEAATVSPDTSRPQSDFAAWVSVFAADTPGDYMDAATMLDTIQAAACEFVKSGTLPDTVNDEETGHCTRRHFKCSECGESWSDDWDCGCNDRCPSCNAETEPHTVEDIEPEECNGCPACDQEGES